MAGVGPTDLHELASDLLAAAVEALDTVPTYAPALGGAPGRSFVAPGPPALDCCDQLTVYVGPISEGSTAPGTPKASLNWINRVQLVLTIARCVPVQDASGNPPSTAAQEESAEQINADKWAIWNHLHNLIADGELFDRCCDVIWGNLNPLIPSGGCGGSVLAITVCFDGYEEIPGT